MGLSGMPYARAPFHAAPGPGCFSRFAIASADALGEVGTESATAAAGLSAFGLSASTGAHAATPEHSGEFDVSTPKVE